MSNNDYYLHRPGLNPSSRATYTIFHLSTNNFYTTMSDGRALLLNPVTIHFTSFNHYQCTIFNTLRYLKLSSWSQQFFIHLRCRYENVLGVSQYIDILQHT